MSPLAASHHAAAQVVANLLASEFKATASIDDMVSGYDNDLSELVQSLLRGSGRLSKADFRRQMKSMIKAYGREGFGVAWAEGGGDEADIEAADLSFMQDWISEQQGFVNDFADWLTDKESDLDQVTDRIALWVASFRNFLDRVLARALGDPIGEWEYGDTEHCDTCLELNGQRHRISWFTSRGYNPRTPGAEMDCGGYRCQCQVKNPKTGERML